ncbi:lysophospholipid acyltransferase family protein [Lichenihabitans sp. Uapishka_5]|uniref:lysophospholipid acyltransferase family protein n=1 Tax=Lichenihabitans sp. Uapishka_5 TaxID=3037302 RepID=UPI003FA52D04
MEVASALSGGLWRHVAPLTHRHGRALAHLRDAMPELDEPERERVIRAMWDNLGRTFAESFHLDAIAADGRVTFEDHAVLEAWAARPGGRVACAGHLGNWELAILGIMQVGAKPWSIYRPMNNPHVDADVLRMRSFLYTGGLVPKSGSVPRQFMKIVRDGGSIGFLSDQRENNGIVVPLFGKPAPSTTFPAMLARSVGAPILMVRMRRLPGVRFVQSFELLPVEETADRKADIEAATMAIQKTFERYVRQAPEQWMWAHRRWS